MIFSQIIYTFSDIYGTIFTKNSQTGYRERVEYMKVLLLNGSPHPEGCTARALKEIITVLEAEGIETEVLQVGIHTVRGCKGCGECCHCKNGRM